MELRHLRYFIAVAEELHFTRAAKRLNIAQPPLSQQIRQLERELGVALFERSRHGVQLTDAGTVFFEHARRVIAAEEEARWAAQRAALGDVGRLVVGFGGSAAIDFLSDVVAIHRSRYPRVQIELHELGSHTQIERLLARQIHVGLLRERAPDDRIQEEVLRREPLIAVLPEHHRLASRARIALRELAEEPFVLAPRAQSSSYTDVVLAACEQAGFQPNVVQEGSETLAVLGLVEIGIGVSLLAAGVQNVSARGVAYRPLRRPVPSVELAMAWRKDDASRLVSAFLESCRAAVAAAKRTSRET